MKRRFPTGLAAAGLTALLLLGLTALPAADDPPLFSDWSAAVNLGPIVNSSSTEACPTISKSGLSLFFRSGRPGGIGGQDVYVSQRDTLEDPWGPALNLGPTVNSQFNEYCTALSPDEHWMVFVSDKTEGSCGLQDMWITHRRNKRDDFGWEPPVNLGCVVNSTGHDNAPRYFENEETGELVMYFAGSRPGGPGQGDIWVVPLLLDKKNRFGTPSLVTEASTVYLDSHPLVRKDGLEFFLVSNRPGGVGGQDIWAATRESMADPWSAFLNLGPLVNSPSADYRPTLSHDGMILIFASERPGGYGSSDLYVTTRSRLRD